MPDLLETPACSRLNTPAPSCGPSLANSVAGSVTNSRLNTPAHSVRGQAPPRSAPHPRPCTCCHRYDYQTLTSLAVYGFLPVPVICANIMAYLCMHMCVCVYVCMYMYICACMYVCIYIHTYVCIYIYTYIHTYVYLYAYIHIRLRLHMCLARCWQLPHRRLVRPVPPVLMPGLKQCSASCGAKSSRK